MKKKPTKTTATKNETPYRAPGKADIGDMARDTLTGFEGLVVGRTSFLGRVDQLYIRPRALKDGKPVKGQGFDEQLVEFVSKGDIPITAPVRAKQHVELGDTVRDPITKLEGTVTAMTTWLEGCVIVEVQPRELKDSLPVERSAFDERALDILRKASPRAEKAYTGGPEHTVFREAR